MKHNGVSAYNSSRKCVIPIWEILGDPQNNKPVDVDRWFEPGDGKTNIYATCANADSMFAKSAVTAYDVYYMLYRGEQFTNISNMFVGRNLNDNKIWNTQANGLHDNPNRYMFARCKNVTAATTIFRYKAQGDIILYSPEFDEDGNMTKIGTLTPLTKLRSLYGMWLDNPITIDRNLLKLPDNQNFDLTQIRYFHVSNIVDNVNINLDSIPTPAMSVLLANNNHGYIGGLFDHVQNLRDLQIAFSDLGIIHYPDNDNPDEVGGPFYLPPKLTNIRKSFWSNKATGTFNFGKLFKNNEANNNLYDLRCAFVVKNPDENTPELIIDNTLFDMVPNLQYFGLPDGSTDNPPDDDRSGNNVSVITFMGFKKKFKDDEFPKGITNKLTALKQFSGLFAGMSYTGVIEDPIDMFYNNE